MRVYAPLVHGQSAGYDGSIDAWLKEAALQLPQTRISDTLAGFQFEVSATATRATARRGACTPELPPNGAQAGLLRDYAQMDTYLIGLTFEHGP